MKLVYPKEYVKEASELARLAKKRIYLLSMVIADHPNTNELIVELENAAKRGVEVVMAADVLTFGSIISDFLPGKYRSKDTRQAQKMARELKKSGVKFQWLGRQRLTIYNGRTHSKWLVIDDTVFSFGGVNMYQQGIDNVDYMLRVTDNKIANRLVEEQLRIQNAEKQLLNYPSVAYEHGNDTILIDGGIVGQSVIHRRACELAEEASSITFVSQYSPTGKLSKILRNKEADCYFNRPELANGLNVLSVRASNLMGRLKNLYKKNEYLHAKFIIFTMKDGSKKTLTGSHNFAYTGVILGTREVALETSNPNIIKQLEDFVKKEIA